jgi:hypothetical protein
MNNLDFGSIAIGAVIVAFLNLLIVVLAKTETLLKSVERIKQIIRLDYRARIKRSDEEIKLLKKYSNIAATRTRFTFCSFSRFGCVWTWEWAPDKDEPINIKAECGYCDQPIYVHFAKGPENHLSTLSYVGIYCSSKCDDEYHRKNRAYFEVSSSIKGNAEAIVNYLVKEAILSEQTTRIAKVIKSLRRQFWR